MSQVMTEVKKRTKGRRLGTITLADRRFHVTSKNGILSFRPFFGRRETTKMVSLSEVLGALVNRYFHHSDRKYLVEIRNGNLVFRNLNGKREIHELPLVAAYEATTAGQRLMSFADPKPNES